MSELEPVLGLLRRAATASAGRGTRSDAPLFARSSAPTGPQPHDDDRYALLRRHFGEHELQLRQQAQLTERILSQLERGETASALASTAPLQQEVRILCTAGGTSGGRFVLRNELGRAASVVLRPSRPRRAGTGGDQLRVRCEPSTLELDAGEERVVRIAVDLSACGERHASELELVVDALADDEIVQKIWVSIVPCDRVKEIPDEDAA